MNGSIDAASFRELFQSTAEPMLLITEQGAVEACNRAAREFFGLSAPEHGPVSLYGVIAETAAELEPSIRRWSRSREFLPGIVTRPAGGSPERVRLEGALLRPREDGRPALLILRARPGADASQRFLLLNQKIDELSREIRERKRAESELRTQREAYRVTLASIGDAVITTDVDCRVTFLNAVAERETGWKLAEALGRPLEQVFDILDERSRAPVPSPVTEAVRRGAVVALANHTVLVRRDGSELPIEDSAAPIRDEEGRVLGVILVFHGVQERRRVQRELALALESEQSSRREAEAANRIKDEFLATLSHELRTPLNAILGWSQLLQDPCFRPASRIEGLTTIERNAKAQVQLIEDLLDMSRILSGKVHLDLQTVDPSAVVAAALDAVRPAALAKGISLAYAAEDGPLRVLADAARLQQVLWNLLANAIKFTPRQGSVVVKTGRSESLIEVSVCDTGIGISPEFLPHVFDRFRQADSSTTRRHGGLGLGLSIVRHLVELHGGTVAASSEGRDRGATFYVRLPSPAPIWPEGGPASPREPDAADRRSEPRCRLDGLRVLVVDDEKDARDLVQRLLVTRGAEVASAASVREALWLVESFRPEIVISDIGMPGADGYELIRRVRRLPKERGGDVRAVALTAFARSEERAAILAAGYQAHVAKPVESEVLVAAVARITGRV